MFVVFAPNKTKNMNYTIDRLPWLGQKHGHLFMDTSERIFQRTTEANVPNSGNFLMHVGLSGGRIQTTISVVDGQVVQNPIWVPNSVFSDDKGNYFIRTLEDEEAKNAKIGVKR